MDKDEIAERAGMLYEKAEELLQPLVIEMRLMEWSPHWQSVMWEAVSIKALQLSEAAAKKRK